MRRFVPRILLGVLGLVTGLGLGLGLAYSANGPSISATDGPGPFGRELSNLTVRVELSKTHVVAGRTIKATVDITNDSGHAINLTRRCQPDFVVLLASRTIHQQVIWALGCSNRPFILRQGLNRFPRVVTTTYGGCFEPGGSSIDPSIPKCLPGGELPPLPPGRYHTVLAASGVHLPRPAPRTLFLSA